MERKNMFEKFRDDELPKELQNHLNSVYNDMFWNKNSSIEETYFKIGFMCGLNFKKYKRELIPED